MTKEILSTYSPEDITVILGGVHEVGGFFEGTFVSISKDVPLFTTKESSDGKVGRVLNTSRLFTVIITLMSTSISNEVLTRISRLDNKIGRAIFPLIIKDTLGSTIFHTNCAWVETIPETEFDINVTSRLWGLKCAGGEIVVGGNEQSDEVEDVARQILGMSPSMGSMF